ncbi:MAG: hypothetical protein WD598_05160 [Acidimicrobiia bacterium]
MLVSLDFLYTPTADVDAAITQHVEALGAELEWKVRGMGTVVACLRVSEDGPRVLLTEHLEGTEPILVYRVASYDEALARVRAGGITEIRELEIPHGPCASFHTANGQHMAVYELVRPEAARHFDGRFDP